MAIVKVIEIKGETKQAQKSFQDLGKTIQEQTDITIQFEKELVDLERQLEATNKAGFNPKAAAIKEQITGLKSAIKDQRISLKELNNEKKKQIKTDNLTLQGATRNYGAIILLDEATGGMASQVRNAVDAGRLFNKTLKVTKTALIATGIGAFVVALGLVITYWDEIIELFTQANAKLQKNIDLNNEKIEVLDTQTKLLTEQEKLLDLQGKSTKANRKQQEKVLKLLVLENDEKLASLKLQQQITKSKAREFSFFDKIRISLQAGLGVGGTPKLISDEEATRIKEVQKGIDEATIRAVKLQQALVEINKPSKSEEKELNKEKKELDSEQRRQDLLLQKQEEYIKKQQDLEDTFEVDKLNRQLERELLELERLGAFEEQKLAVKRYYADLIKVAEADVLNEADIVNAELEQDEIDAEDLRLKRDYDEIQRKKNQIIIDQKLAQQKLNIANQVATGVVNIVGRTSALGKGIAVAQAIWNTKQGVTNALANVPAPWNIAQAIATGLFGLAQVRDILSTPNPAGGGGAGVSVPSASAITAPATALAPSFNVVGTSDSNQLAQSVSNQVQQPIQAFVVSTEVTSQQALDRSKQATASFG